VNIDELKQQIESGQIQAGGTSLIIEEDELESSSNEKTKYCISHGWNIISSKECDDYWTQSNLELLEYIDQQEYEEQQLNDVLNSIQTEDFHWNWFAKSYAYLGDEYRWFYLYAEDKPQGACVIFQPKDSALHNSNIFYIEFVAVAPWNRKCLVRDREFLGVGSILLKAVLRYSIDELGLSPGFSLHSLPQAKTYYEKLNMVNVKERNKNSLIYFELPMTEANKLLEAP